MKSLRNVFLGAALAACLLVTAMAVSFAQEATVRVSIKDHRFQPAEIHAPAAKAITLVVTNLDSTPEEFESKTLRVEKMVAGHSEITLRIRPLDAGRYRFFGDYHEDTAEGYLVVE